MTGWAAVAVWLVWAAVIGLWLTVFSAAWSDTKTKRIASKRERDAARRAGMQRNGAHREAGRE